MGVKAYLRRLLPLVAAIILVPPLLGLIAGEARPVVWVMTDVIAFEMASVAYLLYARFSARSVRRLLLTVAIEFLTGAGTTALFILIFWLA